MSTNVGLLESRTRKFLCVYPDVVERTTALHRCEELALVTEG